MFNLFKKKPKALKLLTANDAEVEYAKKVVDAVFLPLLKRNIETLNKHLLSKNLRAGIEITWLFDKIEE